jgi:hypothetical protein
MRRANIGRSNSSPFRIVPLRGKPSENNSSRGKSKHTGYVFNKDPSGLNFANDAEILKPESAMFAVDSFLPSGDTEIGAGKSANDSIHFSTPRAAVKGSNVRPDRRVVQTPVRNTRRQDCGRRNFDLQVAATASVWQSDAHGEVESAGSAE